MECPNCGRQNYEETECFYCGHTLNLPEDDRTQEEEIKNKVRDNKVKLMNIYNRTMGKMRETFLKSNKPLPIEKVLEDFYVPLFQKKGLGFSEAKRFFHDLLKQAKEESLKDGSAKLPDNYGDISLKKETFDAETRLILTKRREEGVKNEDIQKW